MKPDWDTLMNEYKDHATILIEPFLTKKLLKELRLKDKRAYDAWDEHWRPPLERRQRIIQARRMLIGVFVICLLTRIFNILLTIAITRGGLVNRCACEAWVSLQLSLTTAPTSDDHASLDLMLRGCDAAVQVPSPTNLTTVFVSSQVEQCETEFSHDEFASLAALRYVPVAIALLATICCTALFILWKNIRVKTIWDFKTKILNPILTLVQLFFREVPARTQEIGRTPASPHSCDRPVPTQEWPCSPPCFTTPSACG